MYISKRLFECCHFVFQVAQSPYHYDGYIQLIQLLRQQGDLDKAREARNSMRKVFPLTEGDNFTLWVWCMGVACEERGNSPGDICELCGEAIEVSEVVALKPLTLTITCFL